MPTYLIKSRGVRGAGNWKAELKYNNLKDDKTVPVGASYDDLARQIKPDDFKGNVPPSELRKMLAVSGEYEFIPDPITGEPVRTWVYDSVVVSEWPIDALNYPETMAGIEAAMDTITDLASAKTVIETMAKMIMYLYLESKL